MADMNFELLCRQHWTTVNELSSLLVEQFCIIKEYLRVTFIGATSVTFIGKNDKSCLSLP